MLITNDKLNLDAKSGVEYSPKQLDRVVQDIGKELNIVALPPGDIQAGSGIVTSFLTQNDKVQLSNAYQYALDNGTSLKDVGLGAFTLSVARFREAKVASGTIFGTFDKEESDRLYALNHKDDAETLNQQEHTKKSLTSTFIEKLEKNDLFSANPILKKLMQQENIFNMFEVIDPNYFDESMRNKFFNL